MTALETLLVNSPNLSTLATELYCTSTSLESVDDDAKATTICTSITTALNNIQVPDNLTAVRDAQSYVQSMSVEELEKFDQLLAEKDLELGQKIEEESKVYKKL